MSEKNKYEYSCPYMSRPVQINNGPDVKLFEAPCVKGRCRLWITVFTTENTRTSGCSKELGPQMVDGQLRI